MYWNNTDLIEFYPYNLAIIIIYKQIKKKIGGAGFVHFQFF